MAVYLKTHKRDLSWGDVRATFGRWNTRDAVCVSLQELLFAIFDSAHHDCGSQGVNQVLPVWMDPQPREHVTCSKHVQRNCLILLFKDAQVCRFFSAILGREILGNH